MGCLQQSLSLIVHIFLTISLEKGNEKYNTQMACEFLSFWKFNLDAVLNILCLVLFLSRKEEISTIRFSVGHIRESVTTLFDPSVETFILAKGYFENGQKRVKIYPQDVRQSQFESA